MGVKVFRAWVSGICLVTLLGLTGSVSLEARARRTAGSTRRAASVSAERPAPRGTARSALRRSSAGPRKALYSTRRVGSGRLRRARSRAAAMVRELNDTVIPRYKVDAAGELVPDLHAEAAIVYDPVTQQILWEENAQDSRSIASITKVMTAVVVLETEPDLTEPVEIARSDVYRASTTYLRARDRVTKGDLLHLLLVASDNAAARALARISPEGSAGFVARMNQKAAELDLRETRYADPSGLYNENVSSAYDMARLITFASADPRLASIMQSATFTFQTPRRAISVRNTSRVLVDRMGLQVKAAKTGFITRSGYCLATLLRLPQTEQEVAVVVLGARSNAGRFLETRNLLEWFAAKTAAVFATATPMPLPESSPTPSLTIQ